MEPAPILDREFLEKLERLTLRWQKSFAGLVGGNRHGWVTNQVAIRGRRTGIPRPSQLSSWRRPARGELARLPAPREALPQDVPGGAPRAGAHARGYQRFHERRRRREVLLRAQAGRRALLCRHGAAGLDRNPWIFKQAGAPLLVHRRASPLRSGAGLPGLHGTRRPDGLLRCAARIHFVLLTTRADHRDLGFPRRPGLSTGFAIPGGFRSRADAAADLVGSRSHRRRGMANWNWKTSRNVAARG